MKSRLIQSVGMLAAVGLATVVALQWRPQPVSTANAAHASIAVADDIVHVAMLTLAQQDESQAPAERRPSTAAQGARVQGAAAPRLQEADQQMRLSNPEVIDRCLQVAREIDPELGKQLAQKRDQSPQDFEQMMWQGDVGRRLLSMAQLRQRDPDLYQAKLSEVAQSLQINRVAAQLQEAMLTPDQGRIRTLEAQLKNLLEIQLALSLKSRGEHLSRIEEQLAQLRKEIEHDAANFHAIIESRTQQLLSQPVDCDPTSLIPAAARQMQQEPTRTRRQ